MIQCYKCGEEIAFNKNILSKTGKQIPLWSDQQNTHGHDDDGNPTRGPLPTTTNMGVGLQHPRIKPQQTPQFTPQRQDYQEHKEQQQYTATDRPSLEQVLLSQINTAIATLTKKVVEIETRILNLGEKIDYNTQVDTTKLIGQMQVINDTIAPITKTQIKIGTELYEEQQKQEQKELDEKYKREQLEQKKWNEAKQINSEESDDQRVEEAGI